MSNNENFLNFSRKFVITIFVDLILDYEPNFHFNSKLEINKRTENLN